MRKRVCASELLNLTVEIINSIVEYIMGLLQGKPNLLSPYRSVFVINLSGCSKIPLSIFFKYLLSRNRL